jgi:cell shape-determining protein MreD
VGDGAVNLVRTSLVLLAAFLAVYLEAACTWPRRLLGAQIDLLPGLMVYASLTTGVTTVTLLAAVGGVCFDSLSANPTGISVLPLFAIGMAILQVRHLILREQAYAQWVLGLAASALMPLLTLLLLYTLGKSPLIGAGSLWQWLVVSVGGAVLTPLCFVVFDRLEQALSYHPRHQSSFRSDREIERGWR